MGLTPWHVVGAAAAALGLTAAASRLIRSPEKVERGSVRWVGDRIADLVWFGALFAGGLIAVRYSERIRPAALGYAAFLLAASLLTLARTKLYRDSTAARTGPGPTWTRMAAETAHVLVYLLLALIVYLAVYGTGQQGPRRNLLVPMASGVLLASVGRIRSQRSQVASPDVRQQFLLRMSGRWRTPAVAGAVAAATAPLILVIGAQSWQAIPLGFLSQVVGDLLYEDGATVLWPWKKTGYTILSAPARRAGSVHERWVLAGLVAVVAILLPIVRSRAPRDLPRGVAPFEQAVETYQWYRGRYLMLADVDGAWQATNRPLSGRFEVLNYAAGSFILLDRYSGLVFRAGRNAGDEFYTRSLSLVVGAATRTKPVEVPLGGRPFGAVLPIIYEMQREEGLQHIFLSGEICLQTSATGDEQLLRAEISPTRLPQIRPTGEGCYRLSYLTGADAAGLANLSVVRGGVVAVATYTADRSGPTATPLPSPPAAPGVTLPAEQGRQIDR